MNLTAALKSLRFYSGLSQSEFCKLLNVSDSYVSNIERGKCNPEFTSVQRYSEALNIKFSSIIRFAEVIDNCEGWQQQLKALVGIIERD